MPHLRTAILNLPWLGPLLVAAACWPVWPWYVRRLLDRCDEPWGVVPLGVAALYTWRNRQSHNARAPRGLLWCVPLLLLYAGTYHVLPTLVSAGIAVSAVCVAISVCWVGKRFDAGLWALLILSLPIMLTFQFYAGYPLRAFVSRAAAVLLRGSGLGVEAAGTALVMGSQTVAVDAPCSGVKMLWVGAFAFFTLVAFRRPRTLSMLLAGAASFALLIAGNTLRAASLFYLESGLIPAPKACHAAVGIGVFAATLVAIWWTTVVLARPARRSLALQGDSPVMQSPWRARLCRATLILCLLLAAAAPAWAPRPTAQAGGTVFPGWPASVEGHTLAPQPLSEQEARFSRGFPGQMGRFTAGPHAVTLRWIHRPTRLLHRPEVCFKGDGYLVTDKPLYRDAEGNMWRSFSATRGGEALHVRSRVFDTDGNSWPDISSWFWAAATRKTAGPWWAITVASEPETEEQH